MRALGLDLGSRRIGIAISDSDGTVASAVDVLLRGGDRAGDHHRIAALVTEWEADCVVVGVPYSLDGAKGVAATAALAEIGELTRRLSVPVESYDERLTTVVAEQHLRAQGVSTRRQREMVDAVAAAVMLQGWLDRRSRDRPEPNPPQPT